MRGHPGHAAWSAPPTRRSSATRCRRSWRARARYIRYNPRPSGARAHAVRARQGRDADAQGSDVAILLGGTARPGGGGGGAGAPGGARASVRGWSTCGPCRRSTRRRAGAATETAGSLVTVEDHFLTGGSVRSWPSCWCATACDGAGAADRARRAVVQARRACADVLEVRRASRRRQLAATFRRALAELTAASVLLAHRARRSAAEDHGKRSPTAIRSSPSPTRSTSALRPHPRRDADAGQGAGAVRARRRAQVPRARQGRACGTSTATSTSTSTWRIGPIVAGLRRPAVDDAIRAQLEDGITFSLHAPAGGRGRRAGARGRARRREVRFSKTGCDVTTRGGAAGARLHRPRQGAVLRLPRLARLVHRRHRSRRAACPRACAALTYTFPYNDLTSVARRARRRDRLRDPRADRRSSARSPASSTG